MSDTATAQPPGLQATPAAIPAGLQVLYADEALLVLDKPAGLLAVPGRGEDKQDCLSARAQAAYPDALVVHRLDMATSGLVVMGRGIEAQRALGLAFEQRRVHKRYMAVVNGLLANPQPDNGWNTIDLPLLLDWRDRHSSTRPGAMSCRAMARPMPREAPVRMKRSCMARRLKKDRLIRNASVRR